MVKYIIKYTKTKNLKYISHLDALRVMQRAIQRIGFPIGYSEGYNPHMKMSFGFPISLGIESVGEYFEIELTEDLDALEVGTILGDNLPLDMRVVDCVKDEGKESLMARTAYFDYDLLLEGLTSDYDEVVKLVDRIMKDGIDYLKIRGKKKKPKECNTKDYIEKIEALGHSEDCCLLSLRLRQTEHGSIKISEILDIFKENGIAFKYFNATKTETLDKDKKPLISR